MAPFNPEIHHRWSIRLRGYDYGQAGLYFVTVCVYGRECLIGEVEDGEVRLSPVGEAVAGCWEWLAEQYDYDDLDAFVVMPNHLHGIVVIANLGGGMRSVAVGTEGGSRTAPTNVAGAAKRKPLGRLVGAFKTVSTQRVNEVLGTPGVTLWQRNYYEHVIRNDADLNRIRRYIANNPANWDRDTEHPRRVIPRDAGHLQS